MITIYTDKIRTTFSPKLDNNSSVYTFLPISHKMFDHLNGDMNSRNEKNNLFSFKNSVLARECLYKGLSHFKNLVVVSTFFAY